MKTVPMYSTHSCPTHYFLDHRYPSLTGTARSEVWSTCGQTVGSPSHSRHITGTPATSPHSRTSWSVQQPHPSPRSVCARDTPTATDPALAPATSGRRCVRQSPLPLEVQGGPTSLCPPLDRDWP